MLKLVHLFDVPAAATVADRESDQQGSLKGMAEARLLSALSTSRSLASASRPCLDRRVLVALASRLFARV